MCSSDLYKNIIELAQSRNEISSNYYEVHHIIPKCLGGNNLPENLAKLTAREHFICHWLLTKCINGHKQKINFALWNMMNLENEYQKRYKITSRKYQLLKEKGFHGFLMGEYFMKKENPALEFEQFTKAIKIK